MRSHGLTMPLTFWPDRLVDPTMACTVECSTSFAKMIWQQAPVLKHCPKRSRSFSSPLCDVCGGEGEREGGGGGGVHATPTHTNSSHGPHSHQLPLDLACMLWKTRPASLSLAPSPPHLDCGYWSLAEASLSLLHHQRWRLFKLSLRSPSWPEGLRVCGCCPQDGRTRPSRLPNPRTADDTLAFTGDCQGRAGTSGGTPLVETSNGAFII